MLQSAAVPDAVVLVEAADAVVVAGAAEEGGVLAVLGSEELHPAVVSATSTARTSRPLVVRPIASPPCPGEKAYLVGFSPGNRDPGVAQD